MIFNGKLFHFVDKICFQKFVIFEKVCNIAERNDDDFFRF